MCDVQAKELKQFKAIYKWVRIARKPSFTLADDVRLLMELIQIPIAPDELSFLLSIIDPTGTKDHLHEEDLLAFFIVPEEKKKQREKEISNAFKQVAKGQESVEMAELKACLLEQGLSEYSAQLILKQMDDYGAGEGNFDYAKFANFHIWK